MPLLWIASGIGLGACLAHILYTRRGIPLLLTSKHFRGRLGSSSVESLYAGGTVILAGLASAIVFTALGPPPSQISGELWWLLPVAIAVIVTTTAVAPNPNSLEPSRLRRLLLCLGGASEELIWRGVAISALAQTGTGLAWAYLISSVGFVSMHFARYGRRGMGFIILFSLAMSALAWSFGLLAAVTAHMAWNASIAHQRRRKSTPNTVQKIPRTPADEW